MTLECALAAEVSLVSIHASCSRSLAHRRLQTVCKPWQQVLLRCTRYRAASFVKSPVCRATSESAKQPRAVVPAQQDQMQHDALGVWYTEPKEIEAGEKVVLHYNRSHRPLCYATGVWIHGGYNNWFEGVSIVEPFVKEQREEPGDWYKVEFVVPESAFALNWVLADNKPGEATYYDNNSQQDFQASVKGPYTEEEFFAKVEQDRVDRLLKEQREREEKERQLEAKRQELKRKMKQKTMEQFLRSQSHILYTEPLQIQAGEEVEVFYNPQNTNLAGKPEVWIRGSFNRWAHKDGCFMPIKMEPVEGGQHLMCKVPVPEDAYVMDMVFSESGDAEGGLYDNRYGLDYHLPVYGGTQREPPMHIVHIAVEMAPIAKVGGLGDVVTSLSRAMQELGHNLEIILPKYSCLDYSQIHYLEEKEPFMFANVRIKTWEGTVEGLPVKFLEPENGMFWVGSIYGRKDDGARFEFFCHTALEYLLKTGRNPHIIHCHDWSTAPATWKFLEHYQYQMNNARLVFTIHNLEFGAGAIGRAMSCVHKATTVSPTYAREVAGNGAIAPHVGKFHGIRNGIDPDIWDPLGDKFLPLRYSAEQVVEGKQAAKEELQRRLHLRVEDRPLVGIITRLTAQKGIHLIKHAIWRVLERGGQVVLLGSAPDPRVQNEFQALAGQLSRSHGDTARLWLSYDEPLSHLIYAGADMILVPSIFEPCGLTQMVAMRYGAVPVVRKTGGLNDTVFDVDHDKERASWQGLEPNGFSFEGSDAGGVDYALNRALDYYYMDREGWKALAKRVMEQDWTWNRPALDYLELYHMARK